MSKVVRFVATVGSNNWRGYVLPVIRNIALRELIGKRVEVTVKVIE